MADLIARGLGATDAELGVSNPRARYRVMIRNADYEVVDELSDYRSLTLVKRFNRTGTWALEMHPDSISAPLFGANSGIVVYRSGTIIFSGQMAGDLIRTQTTITVAGFDDNVILEEPARPTPDISSGPYPDAYDVRTGVASTVIYGYVYHNWNAINLRRASDNALVPVSILDPVIGSTITGRANFQSIQAICRELAATPQAGGLGFQLMQHPSSPGAVEFSQWLPVDRTATAKFGVELGTAQDFEDSVSLPSANYWIVLGGDGFGANRTVVEGGDADAIALAGRRVTGVYDARGITDTGELEQKLAELLAGAVTIQKTTIVPFDVPSLALGVDWDFGDVVTVVINGVEHQEVIRELQIDLSPDEGVRITPMIGDSGSSNDELTTQHLRVVQDRLSNIERNFGVPDDSITPVMLSAIDSPSDGMFPVYDSATQDFEWVTADELIDSLTLTSLTVSGTSALGTLNVSGTSTLGVVNAGATAVSTLAASSTVQGTRLISTVAIGTAPLTVTSTTKVTNLNVDFLDNLTATDFSLAGHDHASTYVDVSGDTMTGPLTLAIGGGGNDQALFLKHNSGSGQFSLGASNAADPVLIFKDHSGDQTFEVGNNASTYQARVIGDFHVSDDAVIDGDLSAGRLAAGTTSWSGGEELRVVGQSRMEGDLLITTGTFRHESGGNARIEANSTGLGLFGATPIARPTVVGSRGGNVALASLLDKLSTLGAVIDATTV